MKQLLLTTLISATLLTVNKANALQYRIDGDNRIYVNGKTVAHIKYWYGEWRIHCERGRKSGDTSYRKYKNKEQVIATALSWCKH